MGRYLSWLANSVLVVLCCFLAAQSINTVLAAVLTPPPVGDAASPTTPATLKRPWIEREVILTRNVFNASMLEPLQESALVTEHLEETKLPLELLGTAASDNPELARAAVEDRETSVLMVVGVGDPVRATATVTRIERRRIILEENGSPRELVLNEGGAAGLSKLRPPRMPRSGSKVRKPSRTPRRSARKMPPKPPQVPPQAMGGAARLFSQARMLPKYEGGRMIGVQVSSIKAGSIFEELGVPEGSIITRLNDIEIDSPEASTEALMELVETQDFTITVMDEEGERTLTGTLPSQ